MVCFLLQMAGTARLVLDFLHARIASFMSLTAQPIRYSRYPD